MQSRPIPFYPIAAGLRVGDRLDVNPITGTARTVRALERTSTTVTATFDDGETITYNAAQEVNLEPPF